MRRSNWSDENLRLLVLLAVQAANAIMIFIVLVVNFGRLNPPNFGIGEISVFFDTLDTMEILSAFCAIVSFGSAVLHVSVYRRGMPSRGIARQMPAEFSTIVEDCFRVWGLTPSERQVALLVVKGFTNSEIAALRNTKEGTIKAQNNAVFRKAGVSSRMQLVNLFLDEIIWRDSDNLSR